MLKYGVLNPNDGQYAYADTPEEAASILVDRLIDFFKHHAGGTLFAFIDVDENGAETWFNTRGAHMPTQEQIDSEIRRGIYPLLVKELEQPPAKPAQLYTQGAETL
jgi:hypothetical protein